MPSSSAQSGQTHWSSTGASQSYTRTRVISTTSRSPAFMRRPHLPHTSSSYRVLASPGTRKKGFVGSFMCFLSLKGRGPEEDPGPTTPPVFVRAAVQEILWMARYPMESKNYYGSEHPPQGELLTIFVLRTSVPRALVSKCSPWGSPRWLGSLRSGPPPSTIRTYSNICIYEAGGNG